MKRVTKVSALAYALGVLSVGAVFLGQAAWAALASHAANERVFACVKRNGDVRIVGRGVLCKKNEASMSWSIEGPKGDKGDMGPRGPEGAQGPPGEPGATPSLTSENGLFSVEITNSGVFIRGPGGTLYVNHLDANNTSNPFYGR